MRDLEDFDLGNESDFGQVLMGGHGCFLLHTLHLNSEGQKAERERTKEGALERWF